MRLAETDRPALALQIDGQPAAALAGDTLLVALLSHGRRVRDSEFGDGPRAGFCLMGACQDCWVWTPAGERLRACSTPVEAGKSVCTRPLAQPPLKGYYYTYLFKEVRFGPGDFAAQPNASARLPGQRRHLWVKHWDWF